MTTETKKTRRFARQRTSWTTPRSTIKPIPLPAISGPVVVAIDGDQDPTAPVAIGKTIASRLRTPLKIVSIVEPIAPYPMPSDMIATLPALHDEAEKRRESELREKLTSLLGSMELSELEVRVGHPALEVCEIGSEAGAALVVVGSSPHKRLRRRLAGRRALQILTRCGTPVLAAAPWMSALPRTIVAAIDFGPASLRAVQTLIPILEDGATITLVHVIPGSFYVPFPVVPDPIAPEHATNEMKKAAEAIRGIAPPGLRIETRIISGDPATETLNIAEALNADLITVGTSTHSQIRRLFLGGTAMEIFQSAHCSVLSAPPPSTADELGLDEESGGTKIVRTAEQFSPVVRDFSKRNSGRIATLEEDDPESDTHVEVNGFTLEEIKYDPNRSRLEIAFAHAAKTSRITRSLGDISSISVASDNDGNGEALQIRQGTSRTLLLID